MPKPKTEKPIKTEEPKEIAPVGTELVPEKPTGIVAPIVSPQQALANWKVFQELKKALLDGSDYQAIAQSKFVSGQWISEKKTFIKKSGWRKLATAFNISDEIVKEERKDYLEMEYKVKVGKDIKIEKRVGFVIEATARATAMNGRFATGVGSCASNERGFAHLEHDVRSMAHTRSKNRAISDLIGGGEVSYEEVMGGENEKVETITPKVNPTAMNQECSKEFHDTLPIKTVLKEGKNKGRLFQTCPKCQMFKWIDSKEEEREKN